MGASQSGCEGSPHAVWARRGFRTPGGVRSCKAKHAKARLSDSDAMIDRVSNLGLRGVFMRSQKQTGNSLPVQSAEAYPHPSASLQRLPMPVHQLQADLLSKLRVSGFHCAYAKHDALAATYHATQLLTGTPAPECPPHLAKRPEHIMKTPVLSHMLLEL